ncbi:hypothetical protein [Janthinobacterium sp. RB2R34]|uniref:hypothetical protein n=1 Tax=Janthinobacterium sp. RB2R34 TaxID=3424193 RepID=UPI003F27C403
MAGLGGAGLSGVTGGGAAGSGANTGSATAGGVTAAGGMGRHCGGTGGGITAGAAGTAAITGEGIAVWELPQNGQYATRSGSSLPQAALIQRSFTGSSTLLPFQTSIVANAAANTVASIPAALPCNITLQRHLAGSMDVLVPAAEGAGEDGWS